MALEGPLEEFSINDIISLVNLGKRTGAAEIEGPLNGKDVRGRLWFRGGNVSHANLLNMTAMEAALTFFLMEKGFFRFIPDVLPEREDLRISNEMLIMQGINRGDQWKEIKNIIAPNDIPLMVDNPPGDVKLRPEDWTLLTRITGQDDVATLANKSGLGEFRTMQILASLLKNGLIEKKARNLKYILYGELSELAVSQLGQTAPTLLNQAYGRHQKQVEDDITYEEAVEIARTFGKLAALLVGPGRSQRLVDQMIQKINELFQ